MTTAPVGGSCASSPLGQSADSRAELEVWTGNRGPTRRARGPRGADGLDADAHQRALVGDPARTLDVEAGCVRAGLVGVEELRLVVRAGVPAGAEEQPAALRERAVLRLELGPGVEFEPDPLGSRCEGD